MIPDLDSSSLLTILVDAEPSTLLARALYVAQFSASWDGPYVSILAGTLNRTDHLYPFLSCSHSLPQEP